MFNPQPWLLACLACLSIFACDSPTPAAMDGAVDLTSTAPDAGDGAGKSACKMVTPGPGVSMVTLSASLVAKYPTVIKVAWQTSGPSRGEVRYGLTASLEMGALADATLQTSHAATLKGLPAAADIHIRVEARPGDGSQCSQAFTTIKTGVVPSSMPELTLATHDKSRAEGGFMVVPIIAAGKGWVAILDSQGRYVWWHDEMGTRARLSLDRKAVLINTSANGENHPGSITRIPLDGSPPVQTQLMGIHTDFVEVEHRKYASLGYQLRKFSNGARTLLGETVIEASEGGTGKVVWSSFDQFTPDLSKTYSKGSYMADPNAESWSHVNYISYDKGSNAYIVAARNLNSVIRISRATYKVEWSLGGDQGSLDVGTDTKMVSAPHSAQLLSGAVLVFNNGELKPGECSDALEEALASGKATRTWTYASASCHQISFLGEAWRLSNGNTLISWSTAGRLEEVAPDKKVVWSVQTKLGFGFGFMDRVKSLYAP